MKLLVVCGFNYLYKISARLTWNPPGIPTQNPSLFESVGHRKLGIIMKTDSDPNSDEEIDVDLLFC